MASQLHFVLIPLMAQGHMIPMMDMARLFAERGVMVTIVTTPFNALRFNSVMHRAIEFGLPIRLLQLQFPHAAAGLPPETSENLDTLPSRGLAKSFFDATEMLQEPLQQSLQELRPSPNCIISDMILPWTSDIAHKFQIPRIIFHGTCCFSLLCIHNIQHHKVLESITSDSEPFEVPGLPDRIQLTKDHLPGTVTQTSSDLQDFHNRIRESELSSYGVVGLEASNRPFIWVVRNSNESFEEWLLKEGFEERTKGRGLLIRGWAPQVLILSHSAVGGFLTHCGWNSTVEGVCAGVPMITWPMFAEQFCNEKLIVQILKIGVRIGVDVQCKWGEEEKVGVLVRREQVEKAIVQLMDGGDEAEDRRQRATELMEMAKRAVEEGGSSHTNITLLIQDIMNQVVIQNKQPL
ncbi:PREDICTED: UDP-glycosyltransferase 73C1-like [Nelumbo nucifera]|uniref:Glycosyltransferase n=1 Tax=Nelumbo nucifera TaxID=4432 RepID=A0A1U7Z4H7_NELNU|nr:PREDICTED: UDP-glycosyltransferase 73C1-like [Nelumbo nucifera]